MKFQTSKQQTNQFKMPKQNKRPTTQQNKMKQQQQEKPKGL